MTAAGRPPVRVELVVNRHRMKVEVVYLLGSRCSMRIQRIRDTFRDIYLKSSDFCHIKVSNVFKWITKQ